MKSKKLSNNSYSIFLPNKRGMPEENLIGLPELSSKNLPDLYQPGHNYGLRNWHRDPDVSCLRNSVRQRIADFLSATTSYGKQRAFLVTKLENDLFMDAATKEEYVSQEILNDRLQVLLHRHEDNTAAQHGQEVSTGVLLEPSTSLLAMATAISDATLAPLQDVRHIQAHQSLVCKDKLQIRIKISNGFLCHKLRDSAKADSNKFEDLLPCPKRMKAENLRKKSEAMRSTNGDNVKRISNSFQLESACVSPKELINVNCKAVEGPMRIESVQTQPRFETQHDKETKLGSPRTKILSILEFLTKEQIKDHISSLQQWADQVDNSKENDDNACQLCGLNLLWLAPKPKYCSSCTAPLKLNAYYYVAPEDVPLYFFCSKCYNQYKSGINSSSGMRILKNALYKQKNYPEIEEAWVQCDTCDRWQHQVCGLFNDDQEGNVEYKCPVCWLKETEKLDDYKPLTNFSAKDLPRTRLSNHIEARLFWRLEQERKERARNSGKCFDEVPGAGDLTVRVVLSMKKKVTVKKQLLDTLKDADYPPEFPYTFKLILLFQKIEGVDVCIFSMYVQEFGSECGQPNQRSVYISYIDSIKYFRPTICTSSGEALRTFVFHEIMIGYLDSVKKRGFTTCYIWACSPLKGDDFFFYCHPETQKTPKLDKLRQWYHSMLRKAVDEEIVVNCTNVYDRFFISAGEANDKVTAARLPYFDGDYWSGSVEDFVENVEKESKENAKKTITKTTLKVLGHTNSSDVVNKDFLLMQKLGEAILPSKQNFMVICLQFVCSHCHEPIISKKRWFCNQCNNFHLCERCHEVEPDLYSNDTHISKKGEQHVLTQVLVDMPNDTRDEDDILDSKHLFDDRNKFLRFCQDHNYQFDSLRRAKYSSMMILFRLRHLICPKLSTCLKGYQEKGGSCHNHKLTQRSHMSGHGAMSKEELHEGLGIELLQLLQHANQCRATKGDRCSYKNCSNVRSMFNHASMCRVRAAGGCSTCKKVWYALTLHAKGCTKQDCQIPRCKELQEHVVAKCNTR